MVLMKMTRPQAAVDATQLALLAEKIVAVPDKLAAVHLDLRHICNGDASEIPAGAKEVIVEACRPLHAAIADVSEMAEHVGGWMASNGGARTVLSEAAAKTSEARIDA
jgi:hypothetical protein